MATLNRCDVHTPMLTGMWCLNPSPDFWLLNIPIFDFDLYHHCCLAGCTIMPVQCTVVNWSFGLISSLLRRSMLFCNHYTSQLFLPVVHHVFNAKAIAGENDQMHHHQILTISKWPSNSTCRKQKPHATQCDQWLILPRKSLLPRTFK